MVIKESQNASYLPHRHLSVTYKAGFRCWSEKYRKAEQKEVPKGGTANIRST